VLLISCADKLYNARAILADHRDIGDRVFRRFNAKKKDVLWYYDELGKAFTARKVGRLSDELKRVVGALSRRAR
jgi:hypothetical protein